MPESAFQVAKAVSPLKPGRLGPRDGKAGSCVFVFRDFLQGAEHCAYIESDHIQIELGSRCERINHKPQRGRKIPELLSLDLHQFRELIGHPWRIAYGIEQDRVFVVAVLDGRRDRQSLLIERLVRS